MSILSTLWPPGMSGGPYQERRGQMKGLAVDHNHHLLPTWEGSEQRAELGLALHDRPGGMLGARCLLLDSDHKFPVLPSPYFAVSA